HREEDRRAAGLELAREHRRFLGRVYRGDADREVGVAGVDRTSLEDDGVRTSFGLLRERARLAWIVGLLCALFLQGDERRSAVVHEGGRTEAGSIAVLADRDGDGACAQTRDREVPAVVGGRALAARRDCRAGDADAGTDVHDEAADRAGAARGIVVV